MDLYEILFLVGRLIFGGYFIMSGWNHFTMHLGMTGYAQSKGVPMASLSVYLTGLMMFLGGLGILLGAYLLWSLWLLVIFLVVAAFKMHNFWADEDPSAKMSNQINFMKNLALASACLMMMSLPPTTMWLYALGL